MTFTTARCANLGAFVHRTVVEDEHAYAVRIDDGALLDAAEQTARANLTSARREQAARLLGCEVDQLDAELDTLANRARRAALKLRIAGEIRDRARTGRYAQPPATSPSLAAQAARISAT